MSEINNPPGYGLPKLDSTTGARVYAEWLFSHTLADIERRAQHPDAVDRYTLLGIAPLLRKLLADQHNLVHVVRRQDPTVPVAFRMTPYAMKPIEDGSGRRLVFSFGRQELLPGDDASSLNLKAFLKSAVGQHADTPVSVLDLIHYYLHIEGGVHVGKAGTEFQEALLAMSPTLLPVSQGYLASLAYIAQIVVTGLNDLRRSLPPVAE